MSLNSKSVWRIGLIRRHRHTSGNKSSDFVPDTKDAPQSVKLLIQVTVAVIAKEFSKAPGQTVGDFMAMFQKTITKHIIDEWHWPDCKIECDSTDKWRHDGTFSGNITFRPPSREDKSMILESEVEVPNNN
jgi:hypothetical protein